MGITLLVEKFEIFVLKVSSLGKMENYFEFAYKSLNINFIAKDGSWLVNIIIANNLSKWA